MENISSKLTEQDLAYIGEYITEKFPQLLHNGRGKFSDVDFEQRERIIRVEEELKHQRELMKQGFELMEKRFEQVDKRFEQVDKRFEQVDKRFEQVDKRFEQIDKRFRLVLSFMFLGFTVMTFMMTFFKFMG